LGVLALPSTAFQGIKGEQEQRDLFVEVDFFVGESVFAKNVIAEDIRDRRLPHTAIFVKTGQQLAYCNRFFATVKRSGEPGG